MSTATIHGKTTTTTTTTTTTLQNPHAHTHPKEDMACSSTLDTTGTNPTINTVPPSNEQESSTSTSNHSSSKNGWTKRKWNHDKKNERTKKQNRTTDCTHIFIRGKHGRSESHVLNPGSYVSPAMQTLLGLSIPDLEMGVGSDEDGDDDDETEEGGNEKDREEKKEKMKSGGNAPNDSDSLEKNKIKRIKRKVVLFVAFLGSNYSGFQMNPGARTIQAELEYALYKAGLLSRLNFGYPHKYSWSTSARTDKGVHSCGQVCTVKITFPAESLEETRMNHSGTSTTSDTVLLVHDNVYHQILDMINSHLPQDIRVMDVLPTAKKFCAKTARDKVRYEYMIPSFLLIERKELRNLVETQSNIDVTQCNPIGAKDSVLSSEQVHQLRQSLLSYRVHESQLENLRQVLDKFAGSHRFHNYTRGLSGSDPNALRYIHSFDVAERFVDSHGMEWIPTNVVGQSFLLNQIRKMISMAIDVSRNYYSCHDLEESLKMDSTLRINVAPPNGLYLDMSFYDVYNNRKSKPMAELKWYNCGDTPAVLRWKAFKALIVQHICEEEFRIGNFVKYLVVQEYFFHEKNGEIFNENDGSGET